MINFLTDNSIYLVLIIALIIWLGISIFVFALDNKVKKLENDFKNYKEETL